MRSFIRAALVIGVLLGWIGEASAGLSVSLFINGTPVALFPPPGFTNPDTNTSTEDGTVVVTGTRVDFDSNGTIDLFVDNLTVSSFKNASEGKLTSINTSIRSMNEPGDPTFAVEIVVEDDFGLPLSVPSQPFNVTSTFTNLDVNFGSAVTLESYLDQILASSVTATSNADVGITSSGVGLAGPGAPPFNLKSRFTFGLRPNETLFFEASSIASGRTAVVPELGSLSIWAFGAALCVGFRWSKRKSQTK